MADAPGFFSNIADTPEGEEARKTFEEAGNDDNKPEDKPTTKPEEGTPDEQKGADKDGGKPDDEPKGDGKKPDEDKKDDEGKKPDEGLADKDGGTPDKPGDDKDKPEENKNLILGKYKTVEEADVALQKERESLDKLRTPQEPDKLDEEIKTIMGMALVEPQMPNPEHYNIEEDDGEGGKKIKFDLNAYMGDYSRNLILSLQKELLTGRLAAAQFGLLQKAMGEGRQQELREAEKDAFANDIVGKLNENFPVLKDDQEMQDRLELLILGEQTRRERTAKAENKDPEQMEYEDFEKLAMQIVGQAPAPAKKADEPVEKPKGGTAFAGAKSKTPDDELMADIEGMMNTKKRSIF